MDQQSYIQILKQQPRHGRNDLLDQLEDSVKGVAGTVFSNLVSAWDAATNASVQQAAGLSELISKNTAYKGQLVGIVKQLTVLEQQNSLLNKTFGISSLAAADLSSALYGAGGATEKLGTSQKFMIGYAANIQGIAPTINTVASATDEYYLGLGRVQQVLTTNLGLEAQQAEAFSDFAMQNGDNADLALAQTNAVAKQIEESTGMSGAFKQITEGVAKATADVQLQYGRIPGSLQLGIIKAKALGLEMANLSNAGKNLLNIEQSIGQELEYQLLSGRRLVGDKNAAADLQGKSLTNAYREATLRGDANKQADTLNTILEQEGNTLKNNLFAREQMSKLLGMDEAALSRALQKKSILEKLPGGEALFDKTGDALLAAAKSAGATEADMKELVEATDTRTTDQKIEEVLSKMVDTGIKATLVNQRGAVVDTKNALMKAASRQSGLSEQDIPTETLGAGSLIYRTTNAAKKVINDGVISPDGGLMVSGEKGSIQLNEDDSIVAGTNLGGTSGKTDNGLLSAIQLLVAATQEQTNHLKQLKSDPLFTSNLNAGKYT